MIELVSLKVLIATSGARLKLIVRTVAEQPTVIREKLTAFAYAFRFDKITLHLQHASDPRRPGVRIALRWAVTRTRVAAARFSSAARPSRVSETVGYSVWVLRWPGSMRGWLSAHPCPDTLDRGSPGPWDAVWDVPLGCSELSSPDQQGPAVVILDAEEDRCHQRCNAQRRPPQNPYRVYPRFRVGGPVPLVDPVIVQPWCTSGTVP